MLQFWIFKDNSCYAQNGVNEFFLDPKSTLLDFSQNQFKRISGDALKCMKKIMFYVGVRVLGKFWLCWKWGKWEIFMSRMW